MIFHQELLLHLLSGSHQAGIDLYLFCSKIWSYLRMHFLASSFDLVCVEGQHLTGMAILSPDDNMCYPFLLFFIKGGYIDCTSYFVEFSLVILYDQSVAVIYLLAGC